MKKLLSAVMLVASIVFFLQKAEAATVMIGGADATSRTSLCSGDYAGIWVKKGGAGFLECNFVLPLTLPVGTKIQEITAYVRVENDSSYENTLEIYFRGFPATKLFPPTPYEAVYDGELPHLTSTYHKAITFIPSKITKILSGSVYAFDVKIGEGIDFLGLQITYTLPQNNSTPMPVNKPVWP